MYKQLGWYNDWNPKDPLMRLRIDARWSGGWIPAVHDPERARYHVILRVLEELAAAGDNGGKRPGLKYMEVGVY